VRRAEHAFIAAPASKSALNSKRGPDSNIERFKQSCTKNVG
jgi:hypothetical protein